MSVDVANLEHRQAAQLAAHYLDRGYVNSKHKDAQRLDVAGFPALVRAEIEYRYPHFSEQEVDDVYSWAQAAVDAKELLRQAIKQAAYAATGSADTCYGEMDEVQRAAYMDVLDKIDVHKIQKLAGLPVKQILGCPTDDDSSAE